MAFRFPSLFYCLLLASAAAAGHAAELGEVRVLSHLGQALAAEVELTLIEEPGKQVAVRLANPDVYRGANIAMPPVLSSLDMRVARRDGRQFLHLTSLKPVENRHLHVYLELADGGQRSVRLATLWLTPDPNPAPPPAPAPLPVRQAAAEAPPAAPAPARKPVPVQRPAAALDAGEQYAEASARPTPPVARKAGSQPALTATHGKKAAPVSLAKVQAEAPRCAPPPASDHLNACVALGEKNAALHQQLDKLEEKMKVLQGAGSSLPVAPAATPPAPAVTPAAVATAASPASAPAAQGVEKDAPKGAPRIQRKPKKAAPPEPETPWLPIGAALAAVLGLAALVLALLRRRRRTGLGKVPASHKPAKLPKAPPAPEKGAPKPNFMAAVKSRLMPGRGKGAAVQADEPVPSEVISDPEQRAHNSSTQA